MFLFIAVFFMLAYLIAACIMMAVGGIVAGKYGVWTGAALASASALYAASAQAYACGWSTVAMLPIPRADDWQQRLDGCDGGGGTLTSVLINFTLPVTLLVIAGLAWWLGPQAQRKRS